MVVVPCRPMFAPARHDFDVDRCECVRDQSVRMGENGCDRRVSTDRCGTSTLANKRTFVIRALNVLHTKRHCEGSNFHSTKTRKEHAKSAIKRKSTHWCVILHRLFMAKATHGERMAHWCCGNNTVFFFRCRLLEQPSIEVIHGTPFGTTSVQPFFARATFG